jgi:hypothetical protein
MSVSVTSISFHNGYIDVVLEGASIGFSNQYLTIHDQAFAAAEEHGCHRILIDASQIAYVPNILLEHETAQDLARHCKEDCRVAVLSSPDVLQANLHLETTAQNRGAAVRGFVSREEAVTWLLH